MDRAVFFGVLLIVAFSFVYAAPQFGGSYSQASAQAGSYGGGPYPPQPYGYESNPGFGPGSPPGSFGPGGYGQGGYGGPGYHGRHSGFGGNGGFGHGQNRNGGLSISISKSVSIGGGGGSSASSQASSVSGRK